MTAENRLSDTVVAKCFESGVLVSVEVDILVACHAYSLCLGNEHEIEAHLHFHQ